MRSTSRHGLHTGPDMANIPPLALLMPSERARAYTVRTGPSERTRSTTRSTMAPATPPCPPDLFWNISHHGGDLLIRSPNRSYFHAARKDICGRGVHWSAIVSELPQRQFPQKPAQDSDGHHGWHVNLRIVSRDFFANRYSFGDQLSPYWPYFTCIV